jgi:hypothetical protein
MAPRLTTAALALLGAAAFGALATAAATDPTSVASAFGRSGWLIPTCLSLTALACLALALTFADSHPIVLALALLGAAWMVGMPDSQAWRSLTAVAGGLLLGVAELAYWSVDFRIAGRDQRAVYARRGAAVATLVGASVLLSLVPELSLSLTATGGLALTAAGMLAVSALIGVAATLAWRLRPSQESPDVRN